jgi:DNA-damage-inducible protein D
MSEQVAPRPTPSQDFENHGNERDGRWSARWLMKWLGYESYASFQKAIGRAMQTCSTMEFSIAEHFKAVSLTVDGAVQDDFDLTRFACYITAMNGDPRKPEIAAAQVHFASMTETVRILYSDPGNIDRIRLRDEISQNEKALSGVVKSAGVIPERYGLFHNAGYMGMYNMSYNKLKEYKGFQGSGTLLDFMGRQELAANQFRLAQTEAMIKNENIKGQAALEVAAQKVGQEVRATMIRTSGTYPENLPLAEDIKKVRTKLKKANQELQKLDSPKKRTKS